MNGYGTGMRATAAVTVAAAAVLATPMAWALPFAIVNGDGPDEGLNDPTPVAPVPGNPEVTRGQQRRRVVQEALNRLTPALADTLTVEVLVQFDALGCGANSVVLGQASPTFGVSDDALPLPTTLYPIGLANNLLGTDTAPNEADIIVILNSDLDDIPDCGGGLSWYYGTDGNPMDDEVDLFAVVLHELTHGLGFLTFVNLRTGVRPPSTDGPLNDVYMLNLFDRSLGETWDNLSNAQRASSATNNGNLLWNGPRVTASAQTKVSGVRDGRVQMYAPNRLALGSSVGHFDEEVTPDELMEPFINDAVDLTLTLALLGDIGWTIAPPPECGDGIVGSGEDCDGGACCTEDCLFAPADTACGDPTATVCDLPDTCDDRGECLPNRAPDGTSCDNGMVCDGDDVCQAGVCATQGPLDCGDNDACTDDACVEPTGCQNTARADCCRSDDECDDGNACTRNSCPSPGAACVFASIPGCCLGNGDCDDEDPCTDDVCQPDRTCTYTPLAACEPSDAGVGADAAVSPADAGDSNESAPPGSDPVEDGGCSCAGTNNAPASPSPARWAWWLTAGLLLLRRWRP